MIDFSCMILMFKIHIYNVDLCNIFVTYNCYHTSGFKLGLMIWRPFQSALLIYTTVIRHYGRHHGLTITMCVKACGLG